MSRVKFFKSKLILYRQTCVNEINAPCFSMFARSLFSSQSKIMLIILVAYGTDERAAVQRPRVKSGNLTGVEPFATEISLSGPGALQAAAS